MRVDPVQSVNMMRGVPESYKNSQAQLALLDTSSRLRAEQTLDNRKAAERIQAQRRPIPDEPYAKTIIEQQKVVRAEEQKQLRLKTGQAYEDLPKIALQEKPVIDDLYQLFLENKHVEHPELDEDRKVLRDEVIGLNGVDGDLTMAPDNDDIRPFIIGGRPEIENDYGQQLINEKARMQNPTAEEVNIQELRGKTYNLRSDDLYQVVASNRHLDPADHIKAEHLYSTESFFSPDAPPLPDPFVVGDPNGDPGLVRGNEVLIRAENQPVTSVLGGITSEGRPEIATALNSATAYKSLS